MQYLEHWFFFPHNTNFIKSHTSALFSNLVVSLPLWFRLTNYLCFQLTCRKLKHDCFWSFPIFDVLTGSTGTLYLIVSSSKPLLGHSTNNFVTYILLKRLHLSLNGNYYVTLWESCVVHFDMVWYEKTHHKL